MEQPTTREQLPAEVLSRLARVSTATLCTQLLSRGLRNPFMEGPRPLHETGKLVGTAFTLRYAPAREDIGISAHYDNRTNVQRVAVENIEAGEILVIDARGERTAGTMGNILATRIRERGAVGMVSDGPVRDTGAMAAVGLPVFAPGGNARLSSTIHHPVDMQTPIGCGGVLVMPGDVLVGDADGVVVIPRAWADEVSRAAVEQEELEEYTLKAIEGGRALGGVYPAGDEFLAEYREHQARS